MRLAARRSGIAEKQRCRRPVEEPFARGRGVARQLQLGAQLVCNRRGDEEAPRGQLDVCQEPELALSGVHRAVLANLGQPWSKGYLGAAIVDGTIAAYGILYFISDQGRPARWIKDEG